MPNTVALFANTFVAWSETFLWDEVRHHRRWEVDVFTCRRENADRFPWDRVHVGGPLYAKTTLSPAFDRRFRSGRYQLVHAHFGPGGLYALPYARRHRLPLVVTFHGYDVPLLGSWERLRPQYWTYALLGPRVLRAMTLGLCASAELRELLVELGVPPERLLVHRLGVDLAAFAPAPRPRGGPAEVAMVGRFAEKKGFAYGVRAFHRAIGGGEAKSGGAAAHLTIAGGGPGEARLRRLVDELGLNDRVTFAGVLAPAEVRTLLARTDVLLAPSVVPPDGDRESGVIVVKEACACGAVPVATWHGGIPEIVEDGVTGFLVPERDVDGLARRLTRLLDDRKLRARMAAAARTKMEREYDVRRQVGRLEEIYDEACARFRAAT